MDLNAVGVFVKVVQAGSFSKAARLLGMPNTTVSAKVSSLERSLGLTLLRRTTRKQSLTQAGETFFRHGLRALEELQAGESELEVSRNEPQGMLRITAPVDVACGRLHRMVAAYLDRFPLTKIELILTNRVTDLVGEGIDVAIRTGELRDSTLIARKILEARLELWASPGYLKKNGRPSHPRQLKTHQFIRHTTYADDIIALHRGPTTVKVPLTGRLIVDHMETIKAFTSMGRGIAAIPNYICDDDVREGGLERVLPQWHSRTLGGVYLVYPAQRFLPPKVRAFVDLAVEMCG